MDIKYRILKLILETGEDLSIREIARRLDVSVNKVHYHVQAMEKQGAMYSETLNGQKYYLPQPLFRYQHIQESLELIRQLSAKITDGDHKKLANSLTLFIQLYDP